MKRFKAHPRPRWVLLRALIRNFELCACNPKICRALWFSGKYFSDDFIRRVVLELWMADGDFEKLRAVVVSWKSERSAKFLAWAEKVRGGGL